ncbi:MAG: asparagine synthase (glutamine-hydrolyzing) [Phycisphaerales bacterium]|nr:asparagine synthase (glutamine-hydrolyzing) [Phycisphaerales bacterium]
MCGIAGILRLTGVTSSTPPDVLDRLDAAIAYRGPDVRSRKVIDAGNCELDLLHRRLTILDAEGGGQPMHWPARGAHRLSVVFNGCIYNHRALRERFRGEYRSDHSDTESMLHAWAALGQNCLRELDGMFAMAMFDSESRELWMARDLAGEKPLYYMLAPGGAMLAFASTPGALWDFARSDAGRWQPGVDTEVLARWIWKGYDEQPPMRPIRSVPAGCVARARLIEGEIRVEVSRWAADVPERDNPVDLDAIDAALARSVSLRLDADVPTGCFLSGGIDSALVAGHASEQLRIRGRRLQTFTMRMVDTAYDESEAAAESACVLGTDHTTLDCPTTSPIDDLTGLIDQLALPLGDSSLLPTYWLARAAREHVTVALAGDAGDELFAGYRRHLANWLLAPAMDTLAALPIRRKTSASHPKSAVSMVARMLDASRHRGYDDILAIFPTATLAAVSPEAVRLLPPERVVADAPHLDFQEYLPGDLLRKTDTATMAVAMELRAPLLSPAIVRMGLGTPMASLLAWGRTKAPLRALAARRLPDSITRRPKSGFALPLPAWWRQDHLGLRTCLRDLLTSASPWGGVDLGIEVSIGECLRLVDEHVSGRGEHSQRLYLILVLALWSRRLGTVR